MLEFNYQLSESQDCLAAGRLEHTNIFSKYFLQTHQNDWSQCNGSKLFGHGIFKGQFKVGMFVDSFEKLPPSSKIISYFPLLHVLSKMLCFVQ